MLMLVDKLEYGGMQPKDVVVDPLSETTTQLDVHLVSAVCGVLRDAQKPVDNTFRCGFKLRGMAKSEGLYIVESPDGVLFYVLQPKLAVSTLQRDWSTTPLAVALLASSFGLATLLTEEEWVAYTNRPSVAATRSGEFEVGAIYASKEAESHEYTQYIYLGKYRSVPVFVRVSTSVAQLKIAPMYEIRKLSEISKDGDALHHVGCLSDRALLRKLQLYATCLQASFAHVPAELEKVEVDDLLANSFLSTDSLKSLIKSVNRREGSFSAIFDGTTYSVRVSAQARYLLTDLDATLLLEIGLPRHREIFKTLIQCVEDELRRVLKASPAVVKHALMETQDYIETANDYPKAVAVLLVILRRRLQDIEESALGPTLSYIHLLAPSKNGHPPDYAARSAKAATLPITKLASLLGVLLRSFTWHAERFESVYHYQG